MRNNFHYHVSFLVPYNRSCFRSKLELSAWKWYVLQQTALIKSAIRPNLIYNLNFVLRSIRCRVISDTVLWFFWSEPTPYHPSQCHHKSMYGLECLTSCWNFRLGLKFVLFQFWTFNFQASVQLEMYLIL